MGDWLHVHHCVVCADHATALRVYERVEQAGERLDQGEMSGPTGILWGFWDPCVVLLSTTSKWGSSPAFVLSLIEGLSVECYTASDDEEDEHSYVSFEKAVRARLGARRDFLWSDKPEVLSALLEELEPLDTGLTKLALLPKGRRRPRLPSAAATALAPHAYASVVHGFLTESGACFALGAFSAGETGRESSPLWTPLAAMRGRGSGAWALRALLDGNERLLLHGATAADLWRIERHGAHGVWQPRSQRLARAGALLDSGSAEDRQAGCALARRWWLPEHAAKVESLCHDPDAHVGAAAEFAVRALRAVPRSPSNRSDDPWLGLADVAETRDVTRALERIADAEVGGPARWVVASLGDLEAHAALVVEACPSLAEVSGAFSRAMTDDELGRVFLARLAELAFAATRTSYWMVRYGVPGRDAPVGSDALDQRPAWTGESGVSAARIVFWAARTIASAAAPRERRAVLQGFVAFDELLSALRVNGAWLMPPIGAIHADLSALLAREHDRIDVGSVPPGNAELARLYAHAAEVSALLRAGKADASVTATLLSHCTEALRDATALPLAVDPYAQYGRNAPRLVSWIANNLAWQLFLTGKPQQAQPYAELAVRSGDWGDDAARDTLARVRLALGRTSEAHALVRYALRRSPSSDAFGDLAATLGLKAPHPPGAH